MLPDPALSADNRKHLKALLRRYVDAAIAVLEHEREWPRPFSAPLRTNKIRLSSGLHRLDEERELAKFLHESGLRERLHTTGHTWVWGHEPFVDLFLEQYAERSIGISEYDRKKFAALFDHAWAEISRDTATLRQVITVSGVPVARGKSRLPGVVFADYDMNSFGPRLWKLLGIDYQLTPVSVRPHGSGALLAHDLTYLKKPDDDAFALRLLDSMQDRTRDLVLALRLRFGELIFVEAVHTAQLSTFPLFPFMETPGRDSGTHTMTNRYMTRSDWKGLRSLADAVSAEHLRANGLETIARRFQDSCRWADNTQNVIDLAVCLESLFDVGGQELSYKLATRAASLLARTDEERWKIARYLNACYDIRSELVHGKNPRSRKTVEERITKIVRDLFGAPDYEHGLDGELRQLVEAVRAIARKAIIARVLHPDAWPGEADWNELVLIHGKAESTRLALAL